jgi:hypothetical protein
MSGHRPLGKPDADRDSSKAAEEKEGTRTPEKHERPGQSAQAFSVEVLVSYSHTHVGV